MPYSYPIGIPEAWIDPEITAPARPSPWTSEVAGYYYVNWSTGTDTGRTYGTPSAPRKTIPNPIPAGSRVELASGVTYVGVNPQRLNAEGTDATWVAGSAGPVWVIGEGGAVTPARFQNFLIFQGTCLCCEYLTRIGSSASLTGQVQVSSTTPGQVPLIKGLIRDCVFDNGGYNGTIFTVCSSSTGSHISSDVIVFRNTVTNTGQDDPGATDTDYVGILMTNYCRGIWVLENTVSNVAGGGITAAIQTSGTPLTYNLYIGRNNVSDTWAVGIAWKTVGLIVVSENEISDVNQTSWSNAKGIGGQYAFTDAWVIFNRVRNCDHGIRVGSGSAGKIHIIGNVFAEIRRDPSGIYGGNASGPAAIALWSCNERYIIANTMTEVVNGIMTTNAQAVVIENNIISEVDEKHIWIGTAVPSLTLKNNSIFQTGGSEIIRVVSTEYTVAAFQAALLGTGNLATDPLFVSASDFSLQSGSPARDSGLADTALTYNVYAIYLAQVGVSIAKDRTGGLRPVGSGWDLGAYEYGATPFSPPTFVTHPLSIEVEEGSPAFFSVTVTAAPSPTYQWKKDDVNIGGETGSSLTIEDVEEADEGDYTCVATNSEDSVTSNAATLTVVAADPPDPPPSGSGLASPIGPRGSSATLSAIF